MKKVIVSAFFAMFSMGIFAQANTSKLPANAQDFINQYFSSASVSEVKENAKWQIWESEKFDVILSDGTEIDFDEDGNVLEIDSPNNQAIPAAALPSKITSYVSTNYEGADIVSWEKSNKDQEIELADGTELEFDAEGIFRKVE
ncbi:PepSY-like domain-containing protein [Salinimicrobium sp. GXAS 041]|uniref:PepSY-like domain-containing protein n=1 Tax=Salinimicrobium sp. GXAS 041 TaxID=3400806 RepID=UPI003C719948